MASHCVNTSSVIWRYFGIAVWNYLISQGSIKLIFILNPHKKKYDKYGLRTILERRKLQYKFGEQTLTKMKTVGWYAKTYTLQIFLTTHAWRFFSYRFTIYYK